MTSTTFMRRGIVPVMVRMIFLGLVLATASGCGVLPSTVNDPLQLYTLTPKTTFEGTLPKVDWQLVVELPNAAAGLDTSRVALSRSPYTIEYYSNATWTDNAPAMIQTLLIESFESTRSIVAVGREVIGLRPDFILQTDLREFQAVYEENAAVPTVWVRMNAKLVEMPERRIIASQTFERRVAASGRSFENVIEAFDTALGGVIKQIVLFTLTTPPASLQGDA
ncbi:ABC-type transport auxiliary lipoprotein family protein [Rhodospirillaceae bacterium SYSU D60014]|uniref:ABC-type transport auxiliary lipoprotein family protein n=1 Tax=Virgifigura deserti TaxID=2268457 RepID=UPI000E661DFE